MSQSSSYRMADALIRHHGHPSLNHYIAYQRETGVSWAKIAEQLRDLTSQTIDVSWMTVRRWAETAT